MREQVGEGEGEAGVVGGPLIHPGGPWRGEAAEGVPRRRRHWRHAMATVASL